MPCCWPPTRSFPALFVRLHEHTRQHFEHEGKLMKACRFPAIGEHNSEHLRVLGELAHFRAWRGCRPPGPGAQIRQGLPDWFATHLATMDSALAGCLKRGLKAVERSVPRIAVCPSGDAG